MASSQNERYKSIPIAVTFTLKPSVFTHCLDKQIQLSMSQIRDFIDCTNSSGFLIVELTKNYNVHFHSTMELMVPEKYLHKLEYYVKDYFRKSKIIGFIVVKPITDEIKWLQYMLKNYDKTLDYLEEFDYKSPILWNSTYTTDKLQLMRYYSTKQIIDNKNISEEKVEK